jgi:hypothetical protein
MGDLLELAKLDSGREHADAVTPIFPLDHVGLGAFADDEEALQFRGANTVLTVRGERQAMDTLSVSSILKSANAASGVLVRVEYGEVRGRSLLGLSTPDYATVRFPVLKQFLIFREIGRFRRINKAGGILKRNYESQGRAFESFRARQILLTKSILYGLLFGNQAGEAWLRFRIAFGCRKQ